MRRTKECAEQTRQSIISAAFDIFLEDGFESSSLEKICRAASVTRGAAYWHFKNKRDLYHQTISASFERMDAVREEIAADPDRSMEDKLVELMWYPNDHQEDFLFVGKAREFFRRNPTYSEIGSELEQGDMRLYWFFLTELSKLSGTGCPVEELANIFYTTFLGMHCYPACCNAVRSLSKEMVRTFVGKMLAQS